MKDRVTVRYLVLALLLSIVGVHLAGTISSVIRKLMHPATIAGRPADMQLATRSLVGSVLPGHTVLAIDGKRVVGFRDFFDAYDHARPGDHLRLTTSSKNGTVSEHDLTLPNVVPRYGEISGIVLAVVSDIIVPLVAVTLGFTVAFIRPMDRNAWLLLFLMISFSSVSSNTQWYGLGLLPTTVWTTFWSMSWSGWMLLFGISFPHRTAWDRRYPWLKWLVVGPLLGTVTAIVAVTGIWIENIDASMHYRGLLVILFRIFTYGSMVGICGYFSCLGYKSGVETSPDVKRRLRILRAGSTVALTPLFFVVVYALVKGQDPFWGIPWPITVSVLVIMSVFPFTLAYVIVVGRAMDLSFVVRQGVRYGLARGGLWVVRAVFAAVGIAFVISAARGQMRLVDQVRLGAVGVALLAFRQRTTERASSWVDRKFFREAYDAEQVLGDLAAEAGQYIEIRPLLENVAKRVGNTLHVDDIVILLSEGSDYVAEFATEPTEVPLRLPAGQTTRKLIEKRSPLLVYAERPEPWLRELPESEREIVAAMKSQLLVPIGGNNKLTGVLSLGSKRSEAPWTPTDLRLLQAIASQMGLAVENSRLLLSLAAEAADRERANRELEIAREVQDRLFPQKFPDIPGVACSGYCRPARGVGGDYYDFLQLEDGLLGIAIGDVSGKGIAAALLMASLQASLRGQTMAAVHDLGALMFNVNKLVYEASSSNRYATFFYGEYDTKTRRMRFVNAGHNPPVILRGDEVLRLEAGGPVVGLLPGARYDYDECQLQPGDIFIGFTDGISEALNEQDEEWEEERFIAAANAARDRSPREIIDAIFAEADRFTGKAKQYDDMTLIVVKL